MRGTVIGATTAVVLMGWVTVAAEGAPITITGPTDTQFTMISEEQRDDWAHHNWGAASFANAMPIEQGYRENILIRFTLPSAAEIHLTDPGQISSAILTLHRNDWLSSEGILRLYRLKESWVEGTGTGGSVQTGSADWYDRAHGTSAWSVPGAVGGGSSESTPTATYTVTGEYTIAVDVTSDVQYWYEHGGDVDNFGWVMTCQDSDGHYRYGIRFYSDDFTSGSWNLPSLAITVVPEPATLGLLALGGLALLRRRAMQGRRPFDEAQDR